MEEKQEQPKHTADSVVADLLAACKRALAIEESVTLGQERELRDGFATFLRDVIGKAGAQ